MRLTAAGFAALALGGGYALYRAARYYASLEEEQQQREARRRAEEERQQRQREEEERLRREELAARTCSVCEREFSTVQAKLQHDASSGHARRVHHLRQEQQRQRQEATRQRQQQEAARQRQQQEQLARERREQSRGEKQRRGLDPPFPDCLGQWVWTGPLGDHKSFAFFECTSCRRTWTTAHGNSKYRQGCQGCNVESLPKFMWLNDKRQRRHRQHERDDDDGPHDSQRCEACRRGDCSFQRRYYDYEYDDY